MRIAIVVSHPIQYYTPIFRELALRCDIHVFYGQQLSDQQQSEGGFGNAFQWDVDLLSGYPNTVMQNVARTPSTSSFRGCDTPEIGRHLREGDFDAVLILGWYLKIYIQALVAAKRAGIPALVRGDSTLELPRSKLKRLINEAVNPLFLRLFDGALYVGERSKAFYLHYRYPAERLFFSPHCVDNGWFAARANEAERERLRAELGIATDVFVVLFAGKLIQRKRPFDALDALAKCYKDGRSVAFLVAGSGDLHDALEERSVAAGLPTHMLGFRNQTEMPSAYAAADALVLPSTTEETWGLVANEALACSTPIIVSDACGCAPDLAADGAVGRVSKVGDVADLSRSIASLIDKPPDTAALRERSERYSVARAVDGILDGAIAVAERKDLRSSL